MLGCLVNATINDFQIVNKNVDALKKDWEVYAPGSSVETVSVDGGALGATLRVLYMMARDGSGIADYESERSSKENRTFRFANCFFLFFDSRRKCAK